MFYKKKSFYIILIIIIALIAGGIYFTKKPTSPEYDLVVAEKGELIQEISVTGTVKPAEEVSLAFEKSGKISFLPIKVGDKVKAGQLLASESNADLAAQLKQAGASVDSARALLLQYQAARDSEQAKMDEYKAGAKQEEIQLAETAVSNAQKSLTDAENNLLNVKSKAEADLDEDYAGTLNALAASINVAENTLNTLNNIQTTSFYSTDQNGIKFASEKEAIVLSLLGQSGAGFWSKTSLSQLSGGAKGLVNSTKADPTRANIDSTLASVKSTLQTIKTSLGNLPISVTMSSADILSINTEKTNINAEISALSAKGQALAVQKATNESAIFTAGASITTAQNTLATTKDELQITKSGYTAEQLAAQEAKVKQAEANAASQEAQIKYAEANVQNYQTQISKTTIHSPIVGIVTLVDTKLGEIVAANSNIIKIISEAKYQIEANVPEVDIADIKINDPAKVTLDAYSSDTEFGVKVILIDPAETIIDNVPTYKVTFEFSEENELIKPGMTADLDILTNKKDNVISVPQRAILKKDNKKIVRILNADGIDFKETEVKTGLRGSNGNIEILSGVNEGDKIVISIKNGD